MEKTIEATDEPVLPAKLAKIEEPVTKTEPSKKSHGSNVVLVSKKQVCNNNYYYYQQINNLNIIINFLCLFNLSER